MERGEREEGGEWEKGGMSGKETKISAYIIPSSVLLPAASPA